jgi:hypothetical protein
MTDEQLKQAKVVAALQATSPDNPQWQAVHALLDETIELELEAALLPGVSDAGRHYNAGRAAAAKDFKEVLLRAWVNAQEP